MRGLLPTLFLLSTLAAAPPAAAQSLLVQSHEAAVAQDAAEYARHYGVPLDEAIRRLRAQEESVAATDRIAEAYRDRLAGISIEHRPGYRILVYLTGDAPVPEQRIQAGGMAVPIVFRTGAKATRERMVWAMTWGQPRLHAAFPEKPAMGLDPRSGELVLIIRTAVANARGVEAIDAEAERLTGVPVQVRAMDRTDVNLDVDGGSRVEGISPDNGRRYLCTTGFAVTDGVRLGMTTAAHCLDSLAHVDPARGTTPLEFVGQWGWGYHDVQIHTSPVPLRPLVYADAARSQARPVTRARARASLRAGDFVCHRGESTGYSCAEIELIDFAPSGELCGGTCLPTWVTVSGPGCKGGDSGGPVFAGTTALGILKGGSYRRDRSCAFYFFMSVDYLPKGWSLLTEAGRTFRPARTPSPLARSGL